MISQTAELGATVVRAGARDDLVIRQTCLPGTVFTTTENEKFVNLLVLLLPKTSRQ